MMLSIFLYTCWPLTSFLRKMSFKFFVHIRISLFIIFLLSCMSLYILILIFYQTYGLHIFPNPKCCFYFFYSVVCFLCCLELFRLIQCELFLPFFLFCVSYHQIIATTNVEKKFPMFYSSNFSSQFYIYIFNTCRACL